MQKKNIYIIIKFTFLIIALFLVSCSRTPQRIYYLTTYGNHFKKAAENTEIETLKNILEADNDLKFRSGNKLAILQTGDVVLNRMFELIKNAETEICVDQYIFRKDEVGLEFFRILEEKAAAGVNVRVIIDNIGSFRPSAYFSKRLEYSKIKARLYNPVFWWSVIKINNRDHNKILVVDNKIAVVSGIGLGKEFKYWRDIGVEVEGPVLFDIQSRFEETWIKSGYGWLGKEIPVPYLNSLKLKFDKLFYDETRIDTQLLNNKNGNSKARFLYATPKFSDRATFESFLKIINSAKKYVYLTNAYFMPNIVFRKALTDAVKRGVDVKIILPSKSDLPLLRRSSEMFYKSLLNAGIKIYELKDNILHAKYMVVDDIWATIGSTNILDRSFFMNMEANIEVLDSDFSEELKKIFFSDLENSNQITVETWNNRSFGRKITNYLFFPSILFY